ncbi:MULTISPECIES: hypothetical protein [Enterobacter]
MINGLRQGYNEYRPHLSLNDQTPS